MTSAIEHTLLCEVECSLKKTDDESSPPESKRVRLESNTKWSFSGDTSFVEPEILEDMGVGMLENITNIENAKQPQSRECKILPANSCGNKRLSDETNKVNDIECNEQIRSSSNLDITNTERLEQDECNDLAAFNSKENKSNTRVREICAKERADTCADKTGLDQFYLYRRKRKSSVVGEDKFNKLSDEIILMILKWLPKKCLVRSMLVCKRWCQIARDEVLWTRLDLGGKVLDEGTLGHILPRGVQILRLAQAEIADSVFTYGSEVLNNSYISKLQYLDLSMAVISPNGLASLLFKCKHLKKLSLEKCVLNKECCRAISQNTELEVLNLTMCEDMTIRCILDLMKLKRLTALNLAWCCLDSESMYILCKTLPSSITRLNVAGCRKTMTDENVRNLSKRCPNIIELDLSDCAILTINAVNSLLKFSKLEHLSLSRCYSIPQTAYVRLAHMPCLLYFDVFALMSETVLKSLQDNRREPEINKFLYSSIARPTVGIRRTSIWGLRVRD